MAPLAAALDILQGETSMYMGFLLPVISSLEISLQNLKNDRLTYCEPLRKAVLDGVT